MFKNAGLGEYQAMVSSMGFGLINFVFAFPAFWTIDTFGRRTLLLFTFPQMVSYVVLTKAHFCKYSIY